MAAMMATDPCNSSDSELLECLINSQCGDMLQPTTLQGFKKWTASTLKVTQGPLATVFAAKPAQTSIHAVHTGVRLMSTSFEA